ncbi:MAG: topoisomerase DNA-binding C4 zinc finger domain-containing protein [Flavobacteriales bacterium]|jgi:ssDNA-binding Zn-finger/Zn-ribbon topoisomerase 1|nr:topoisomerase DNA-binding C4 zinc finger domain-containing protein [Flavobacteriales bacterium]
MKKVNYFMTGIAVLLFAACGNNNAAAPKEGATEEHRAGDGHDHGAEGHEGHQHETYYTCEHHPEVHEHAAGKCPKCNMDLVAKEGEGDHTVEEHKHEGHNHEAYFTCSDHPGVHMHDAGKCPNCGKDMIKKEGEEH